MKISMIHPSKGRSEVAYNLYRDIVRKSSKIHEVEYILVVDQMDKTVPEYIKKFGIGGLTIAQTSNCVQALNIGAEKSTGDILIYVSDDFEFPKHWDMLICNKLDKTKKQVLWVSDGHRDDLMTGLIMTRQNYIDWGFMYHPEFESMWADNFAHFLAFYQNRVIISKDITILHNHYCYGGLPQDKTYDDQNAPERYKKGQETYEKLRKHYISLGAKE